MFREAPSSVAYHLQSFQCNNTSGLVNLCSVDGICDLHNSALSSPERDCPSNSCRPPKCVSCACGPDLSLCVAEILPDVRAQLEVHTWEDTIPRIELHAIRKAKKLYWQGLMNGNMPGGKEAQDVVQDAKERPQKLLFGPAQQVGS